MYYLMQPGLALISYSNLCITAAVAALFIQIKIKLHRACRLILDLPSLFMRELEPETSSLNPYSAE